MLIDPFGRIVDYLRISITDKCNYRCIYCMPKEGVTLKRHDEILRLEDLAKIAQAGAELGIRKIRLTGGEPLVRKNIVTLIKWLSGISKIQEVVMTTNGSLLTEEFAVALKKAGLGRINISLDTLNPVKFHKYTRLGNIEDVLRGIQSAKKAGLLPIKINMVIFPETSKKEIDEMSSYCESEGFVLQKIMQFSLYDRNDLSNKFHTERPPKCESCNRLRLTADGHIKPCLFSDSEIKVNLNNIEESILKAVASKPKNGTACTRRTMDKIGG